MVVGRLLISAFLTLLLIALYDSVVRGTGEFEYLEGELLTPVQLLVLWIWFCVDLFLGFLIDLLAIS